MKPHLIRAIEVSLLVSALSACVTVEHPQMAILTKV